LHRDPGIYADPDSFDPDRWLPERAKDIPRPAYIPFGAGNRQCIGDEFALMEAIIVLATIVSKWRMRPVPGVNVRMRPVLVLRPSELPMVPQLRSRSGVGEVGESAMAT
jgi:pentalenene oxygenase